MKRTALISIIVLSSLACLWLLLAWLSKTNTNYQPADTNSPPPMPWATRMAIRASIEGATTAPALVNKNHTPVTRNVRLTPTASMTGPATMPATADVAKKALITQGASATRPRSPVMEGRAATIAKPSKATIAMTNWVAIIIGNRRPDQMPFSSSSPSVTAM